MLFFQLWTLIVGIALLILGWRTLRFTKNLVSLRELPEKYKLSEQEMAFAESGLWPKVSVVIPACNEGETIQAALGSLLMVDYPNLEIIVVNDRSNDKTRQIIDQLSLVDERIVPVHVNHLPEGWLGKVNALSRGMEMTTAEWVLLTDADVHFAPDSIKNAVIFCLRDRADFLTVIPDIVTNGPILQIVIAQLFHQASLFFQPDQINNPKYPACYGQGAFMLVRKSTYRLSEKLEWLKMEVVDDTGFALLMRRAGARMAALAGKSQIQLEWYPSFGAFIRGIEKNAFAFSQYSLSLLVGFSLSVYVVAFGFLVAPFLSGNSLFVLFSAVCLSFYLLSVRQQLAKILTLRSWAVLAFPIAFMVLPILFLRASLLTLKRGGVNWRGTFYDLSSLKSNQRMKLANLVFSPPTSAVVPIPLSELPSTSSDTRAA